MIFVELSKLHLDRLVGKTRPLSPLERHYRSLPQPFDGHTRGMIEQPHAHSHHETHGLVDQCRQPLVTGTSVLGIQFEGGIMLAADNLGTSSVLPGIVKPLGIISTDRVSLLGPNLNVFQPRSVLRLPRSIQGYSTTLPALFVQLGSS
jgi:hypothetical protein